MKNIVLCTAITIAWISAANTANSPCPSKYDFRDVLTNFMKGRGSPDHFLLTAHPEDNPSISHDYIAYNLKMTGPNTHPWTYFASFKDLNYTPKDGYCDFIFTDPTKPDYGFKGSIRMVHE